jgi:hypothetical protein
MDCESEAVCSMIVLFSASLPSAGWADQMPAV